MKTAIWKYKALGDLLLLCVSDGEPRDEDLEGSLALHRKGIVKKALLWAIGDPTISAAQRKRTAEAMGKNPNYVITTSAITRGIITAMSWLGQPMRACSPDGIREAIRDLGVPAGYTEDRVFEELSKMRNEVLQESVGRVDRSA
jgi:hypothetical protein